MFGGPGGARHLMNQEVIKPKRVGETLARFGWYFRPYWFSLVLAALLVIISTWAQGTHREITAHMLAGSVVPDHPGPLARRG